MLNLWINFLLQMSPGPVIGFAIDSMLPVKKNAPPKWARIGLWCVAPFAAAVYRIFIHPEPQAYNPTYWIFHLLATIISVLFIYDGKIWHILAANMAVFISFSASEAGAGLLLMLLGMPQYSLDFTKPDMVLGGVVANLSADAGMLFTAFLWRRFKLQKRISRGSWMFVIMPLLLIIPTLAYCVEIYNKGQPFSYVNLFTMLVTLIFNIVLICVQFNQAEKYEVEKELSELKQQSELERQYYNNVEARREEMAKIRHDYNNLISSVIGLLQMDKTREAEETMKGLLAKVEETREYPYCGIPIVNAILSEKEEVCRKNGIELQTDLLFPDDTAITPVDLCSIFANLLDNAIRACNHLPPEHTRKIDLNVAVQGDYLLIRCDNPSLKAPGKRAEGTGYGLKILNDISKRYGGEFKTNFEDGIFTARLILLCT